MYRTLYLFFQLLYKGRMQRQQKHLCMQRSTRYTHKLRHICESGVPERAGNNQPKMGKFAKRKWTMTFVVYIGGNPDVNQSSWIRVASLLQSFSTSQPSVFRVFAWALQTDARPVRLDAFQTYATHMAGKKDNGTSWSLPFCVKSLLICKPRDQRVNQRDQSDLFETLFKHVK